MARSGSDPITPSAVEEMGVPPTRLRRFRRLWFVASVLIAGSWACEAVALADPGESVVSGNSGSAQWTIPIDVPPGPAGSAPKLALTYSSSAGDGPFGLGWTLPLGEIACSV